MGRIGLRNDASTAVNIAMKIRSFPYVWGGTSLSAGGFDCSGFVSIWQARSVAWKTGDESMAPVRPWAHCF